MPPTNTLITIKEASELFGFSTDRIRERIKRLNIKPVISRKGPLGRLFSFSDIERAIDLIPKDYVFRRFDGFSEQQLERYKDGEQMQTLINESGFSPAVVYRYYKKHPLPIIDSEKRVMSKALAAELNIGVDALREIRKKLNIPLRYAHDGSSSTYFTLEEAEKIRKLKKICN